MNTQQQIDKIRLVMIKKHTEECNTCGMEWVPMIRINGEAPCPRCDAAQIEAVKLKKAA